MLSLGAAGAASVPLYVDNGFRVPYSQKDGYGQDANKVEASDVVWSFLAVPPDHQGVEAQSEPPTCRIIPEAESGYPRLRKWGGWGLALLFGGISSQVVDGVAWLGV